MESLIYRRKPIDFYNYTDLNRVEDWIQHLHTQLKAIGYAPVVKSRKTWDADSIPRQSAIDAIRNSIIALRNCFFVETPVYWVDFLPGETKTSRTEWDAWEWDLHLISDAVDAMISNSVFRHANTVFMYSGGELQ